MGEVVQLDDRRRAQEKAALWLSRLDRGLTESERHELDLWLRASPTHTAVFVDLAKAWDKLEDLSALSGLVELPPPPRWQSRLGKRQHAVAAAIGGLLIVLGVWIGSASRIGNTETSPAASRTPVTTPSKYAAGDGTSFTTGTGEQRRITLQDGTVVSLNTRSTLVVAFTEKQREVRLKEGEATFEVAHDNARPFVVQASGRAIRAVGTVFTVRAKSKSSVSVIVSEGRVAVARNTSTTREISDIGVTGARPTRLLEAGDRLELIDDQVQLERLSLNEIDDALAWQNGMIVFQGEPLLEALGEVSRYSDARFELAEDAIGEMKVAGVFQIRDLNGFVDSLRVNLGIGAKKLTDGTLSLYRVTDDPDNGTNP